MTQQITHEPPAALRSRQRPRIALSVLTLTLIALTVGVELNGWPVRLDRLIANHMPHPGTTGLAGVLLGVAEVVTVLATPTVTVALTVGIAARWSWQERSTEALRATLLPVAAMSISVLAGKLLFHRAALPGTKAHHLLGLYPSGHTATALVCTATLAILAGQRHPTWAKRLLLGSGLWTVLVAVALVVHRYHWLTDVIAALLLAGLILIQSHPRQAAGSTVTSGLA